MDFIADIAHGVMWGGGLYIGVAYVGWIGGMLADWWDGRTREDESE